jgi:hypothetical protein
MLQAAPSGAASVVIHSLNRDRLVVTGSRIPRARLIGLRHIQLLHVVRIELKVVDVSVVLDALRCDTLR